VNESADGAQTAVENDPFLIIPAAMPGLVDGRKGFGFCGAEGAGFGVLDAFEMGIFQDAGVVERRGGGTGNGGGCADERSKNTHERRG